MKENCLIFWNPIPVDEQELLLEMTMGNRIRIAVIGAGASGMMSAITAASHGGEVTLYEKNDRVGKKLLATGNGKCNLSNLNFSVDQY